MNTEVIFVSMPFGQLLVPSIGLGLLKSAVSNVNIKSKTLYLHFRFAELIGVDFYSKISSGMPLNHDLAGEWIFSHFLFKQSENDAEEYIDEVIRGNSPKHLKKNNNVDKEFIDDLLNARSKVNSYIDECASKILEMQPKIVIFTSIFQQHLPTIAAIKRIKEINPNIFTIVGGANCEGIMGIETIRQFCYIDAVISGEGDIVLPKLLQGILKNQRIENLQGVFSQDSLLANDNVLLNAPSVTDLDTLPIPDYQDYFEQLKASNLYIKENPRLLFETSRGCWWGEKNHCTFCGLNGSNINFRSKSADRALNELVYLTNKYPECSVSAVDNILDLKYFQSFIPDLIKRKIKIELFYEVKANLKKNQVKMLKDAGITTIQPGIESLSDQVLKIMRKGITGLQNIQLLKWCKEYGVRPEWNMLWGFPGESPEEYQKMSELIPLISHLFPPASASNIRLDRFSPNFVNPEKFGFTEIAPYPSYSYIYALPNESVSNLAYYFTFNYQEKIDVASYVRPLANEIAKWKKSYYESDLISVDKGEYLIIWDLRPLSIKTLILLSGTKKKLYQECDRIRSIEELHRTMNTDELLVIDINEIYDNLQILIENSLMIRSDNFYLSLAIPLGYYSPNNKISNKLLNSVKSLAYGDVFETETVIESTRYMLA